MECKSAARCTLIRLSKASLVTNNSPEASAKKSLKIFLVSRHLIVKLISSCHSQSHSCSENYIITVTDYHEYIPEMSERAPQNYARASESYVEAVFHVEGRNLFRNAFFTDNNIEHKSASRDSRLSAQVQRMHNGTCMPLLILRTEKAFLLLFTFDGFAALTAIVWAHWDMKSLAAARRKKQAH